VKNKEQIWKAASLSWHLHHNSEKTPTAAHDERIESAKTRAGFVLVLVLSLIAVD
jgi:hypothetical protein